MFKKWHITLFVLLLCSVDSAAQSITLFDYKLDEYPKITAKFHSADSKGDIIDALSPLDFDVYENGEQQTINNINCPNNNIIQEASVVVAIDRSSYWDIDEFDVLKTEFQKFIKTLYLDKSQVAVSVFNKSPLISTHFINDENELLSSLDNISISGVPNLSEAIENDDLGLLKISESGLYARKHIVLIANRYEDINFNAILDSLDKYDIVFHAVFTESKLNVNWKNLIESSGGNYYYGVNTQNKMQQTFLKIARDVQDVKPCEIIWKNESCDTLRNLDIEINTYSINNIIEYIYPQNLLPYIQLSDLGYLEYGLIPQDSKVEKTISITARNKDIHVQNIKRSSTLFTITDYGGSPPEFTLNKDESRQIRIEYFALDTHYIHAEFEIVTDVCRDNKFYVSAGSKKGTVIKETIDLIKPNGGEELIAGSIFPIEWSGILPADTVYIDLSIDNASTWNPIIRKSTGLAYQWKVPIVESNECLVRIDHISQSDNFEKIHFINGHRAGINGISWSPLGSTLATSANDDSIKIWDPIEGTLKQTIYSTDETLYSSHWGPDSEEYIITTVNKPFGLIFISDRKDSVHALEGIVKVAKWSSGGSSKLYVSCGTDEGKVYIWEYLGSQQEPIFVSELSGHDGEILDIAWNNFSSIVATAGRDGKIILWNPINGEIIEQIKDYDYALKSISWSPDGKYIAVAGDNPNIDIWDINSGELVGKLIVNGQGINEVEWDPGNKWIAAASGHDVYLWNVADLSLYYIYTIHDNRVNIIEWRDDSKYIASGDLNSSVQVWDPTQIPFENHIIQSDISDDLFTIVNPILEIADIIFNPTTINNVKDSIFTNYIRNSSNYPIIVDSIVIEDLMGAIFLAGDDNLPVTLEQGETLDVLFTFHPPQNRLFSAKVMTYTQNRIYETNVSGRGLPVKLVIVKNKYDFGDILLSESVEKEITIVENISITPIKIKSIEIISLTEEFSIINNPLATTLAAGEELELQIAYNPEFIGLSNAIVKIVYDNMDSIITVNIFGEGIAPDFALRDIDFDTIECSNTRVDSVLSIINLGRGDLNINDIEIVGTDPNDFEFEISSFETIPSGENMDIVVSFVPRSSGYKTAEIIINHNIDEKYSLNHKYSVSGNSDSVGYYLSNDILTFDNLGANETKRESFSIFNTGNTNLDWILPIEYEYFTIESVDPNPTLPNGESIVTVLFKGGKADTSYIQTHLFSDKCEHTEEILFIANTGKENPIADISDNLNFPILVCESAKDTSFVIRNIGTSTLVISNIELDESSDDVFSLCDEFEELTIAPNESGFIRICVNASQGGFFNGTLIVSSNSTSGETIEIPISAQREIYLYNITPASSVFNNVTSNIEYLDTLIIHNIGTIPIAWEFPVTSDRFIIENVVPNITKPSGFSELIIRFTGGDKGEEYNTKFQLPDSCNLGLELECTAIVKGSNYAVISTQNLQARPGDVVRIPIFFNNPENINFSEFQGVETQISFDASLLIPVDEKYKGIISRGKRTVDLNIEQDLKVGEIFSLECIAALGNKKSTDITFSNPKPIGTDKYFMESASGSFELILDCENDPNKFIDDSGVAILSVARPNPANDIVRIDFRVIEKGRCKIELFDIYGSKIADLFNEFVSSGDYNIMFDVRSLPSGNYIYKMTTFSQTFIRKLIIIK